VAYLDNNYKFVVLLNRHYEAGTLTNALAHAMAGFIAATDTLPLGFLNYTEAENSLKLTISRYPVITLAAPNGNQLRVFREKLIAAQLPFNAFCHTMLGASADSQLAATRATAERELDWIAVVTFGPRDTLDPLTKKFSIFKGDTASAPAPVSILAPLPAPV